MERPYGPFDRPKTMERPLGPLGRAKILIGLNVQIVTAQVNDSPQRRYRRTSSDDLHREGHLNINLCPSSNIVHIVTHGLDLFPSTSSSSRLRSIQTRITPPATLSISSDPYFMYLMSTLSSLSSQPTEFLIVKPSSFALPLFFSFPSSKSPPRPDYGGGGGGRVPPFEYPSSSETFAEYEPLTARRLPRLQKDTGVTAYGVEAEGR